MQSYLEYCTPNALSRKCLLLAYGLDCPEIEAAFSNTFGRSNSAPEPVRIDTPYLTVAEAAAYLRTTVQGVYSLVKRGRIKPHCRRKGKLLFTRQALDNRS